MTTATLPISKIPKNLRKLLGISENLPADKKVQIICYTDDEEIKQAEKLELEKSFEINSKDDFNEMVTWLKDEN